MYYLMLIVSISCNHWTWAISTIVFSGKQQNGFIKKHEEKLDRKCAKRSGFEMEYKTNLSSFHHFEILLLKSGNFWTIEWTVFTILRISFVFIHSFFPLKCTAPRGVSLSLFSHGKEEFNFTKRFHCMYMNLLVNLIFRTYGFLLDEKM